MKGTIIRAVPFGYCEGCTVQINEADLFRFIYVDEGEEDEGVYCMDCADEVFSEVSTSTEH